MLLPPLRLHRKIRRDLLPFPLCVFFQDLVEAEAMSIRDVSASVQIRPTAGGQEQFRHQGIRRMAAVCQTNKRVPAAVVPRSRIASGVDQEFRQFESHGLLVYSGNPQRIFVERPGVDQKLRQFKGQGLLVFGGNP